MKRTQTRIVTHYDMWHHGKLTEEQLVQASKGEAILLDHGIKGKLDPASRKWTLTGYAHDESDIYAFMERFSHLDPVCAACDGGRMRGSECGVVSAGACVGMRR